MMEWITERPPNAVIRPPDTRLKWKVGVADADGHRDAVAAGERAFAGCADFLSDAATGLLKALRDAARAEQPDAERLLAVSHELRGMAGVAGMPGVGALADALHRYLETAQEIGEINFSLVRLHVDAVAALAEGDPALPAARPALHALGDAVRRALARGPIRL